MFLNTEKSVEKDKECSKEWLVNTDPGPSSYLLTFITHTDMELCKWKAYKHETLTLYNTILTLTLYHTIPTFNDSKEEGFRKHFGKRKNTSNKHFFPFPIMFCTVPKTSYNLSVAFILLSVSSLNLDWSNILLFGKVLNNVEEESF